MNRRFVSFVSGFVLVISQTSVDGFQTQPLNHSENRPREMTRLHRDRGQSHRRPAWVAAAVTRAQKHLAVAKGEAELESPDTELVLDSVIEDDLGRTHVLFDQVHNGVLILASQIVVELDELSGNKILGTSDLAARLVDTTPAISRELAAQIATTDLGHAGQFAGRPTAELVILPATDGRANATLTWVVELGIEDGSDATAWHRYLVSAEDGGVVMHYGPAEPRPGP
jgi:Zn-dependent metalloprotease